MADADVAAIARLIGDHSRATMLTALLDGRALTAGELARAAAIGAPAASAHLGKLLDGGLVEQLSQGRHRYYRLANADVAHALEALAAVSPIRPPRSLRASQAAVALKPARLCYDHLAGELGVQIYDHLAGCGALVVDADGLRLTETGERWFARAGVELENVPSARRPRLRACLDWTERRPHLAGSLAAALAATFITRGWLHRRAPGERGLVVTAGGHAALEDLLLHRYHEASN